MWSTVGGSKNRVEGWKMKQRICPECGQIVSEYTFFCTECGSKTVEDNGSVKPKQQDNTSNENAGSSSWNQGADVSSGRKQDFSGDYEETDNNHVDSTTSVSEQAVDQMYAEMNQVNQTNQGVDSDQKKKIIGIIAGVAIVVIALVLIVPRLVPKSEDVTVSSTEGSTDSENTGSVEDSDEEEGNWSGEDSEEDESDWTEDGSDEEERDWSGEEEEAFKEFMLDDPYLAEAATNDTDIDTATDSFREYTDTKTYDYSLEKGQKDGVIGCYICDINNDGAKELISISIQSGKPMTDGKCRTETRMPSVLVDIFYYDGKVKHYGDTLELYCYFYSEWALSTFDILLTEGENGCYLTYISYKSEKSNLANKDPQTPIYLKIFDLSNEDLRCEKDLECKSENNVIINGNKKKDLIDVVETFSKYGIGTDWALEYLDDDYFGYDGEAQKLVSMYVGCTEKRKQKSGRFYSSYWGGYIDYTGCREWLISDGRADLSDSDDYIIAYSSTKYLSRSDLKGLSQREINLAKNEIYARHGRTFKNQSLQDYFDSKDWYEPQYDPEEFDEIENEVFNKYEKANTEFLNEIEKQIED